MQVVRARVKELFVISKKLPDDCFRRPLDAALGTDRRTALSSAWAARIGAPLMRQMEDQSLGRAGDRDRKAYGTGFSQLLRFVRNVVEHPPPRESVDRAFAADRRAAAALLGSSAQPQPQQQTGRAGDDDAAADYALAYVLSVVPELPLACHVALEHWRSLPPAQQQQLQQQQVRRQPPAGAALGVAASVGAVAGSREEEAEGGENGVVGRKKKSPAEAAAAAEAKKRKRAAGAAAAAATAAAAAADE